MKKALLFLSLGLLCGVVSASADDTTWTPDDYEGTTWQGTINGTQYHSYNWMAALPDNLLVAHVSIPGTHDSASGGEWASTTGPGCSTTQACEIPEMLARGIRAWDFRPGVNGESGTAYCYHGTDRLNLSLKDAFAYLTSYLTGHPTEFFVVHLFRGNVYSHTGDASTLVKAVGGLDSDAARTNINNQVKDIMNGSRYVEFRPNLTVGEARGKIVVLRRDRCDYLDLPFAGYMENWDTNFDVNNPVTVYQGGNSKQRTILHAQDISEGDDTVLATKQEHCQNLIDWTQTQENPNDAFARDGYYTSKWVLNFTSIDNSGSSLPTDNTNGYKGGASIMNPRMADYINENLGRGPLGIFLSDYVLRISTKKHGATTEDRYTVNGDQLVYNIIQNNYTADASGKTVAERFALTDEVKNQITAEVSDPYADGTYFLRNVATGLYFAEGGNWGAHAVANKIGIPVQLALVSGSSNAYTFTTTFGLLEAKENQQYLYLDGAGTNFTATNVHYEGKDYIRFEATLNNARKAITVYQYNTDGKPSDQYTDRPTHYVDPGDINGVDPMQLWEVVTYDERMNEIKAKANPDRPMNCSFLIPAHGFGNGDSNNGKWTLSNTKKYAGRSSKAVASQGATAAGGIYRVVCTKDWNGVQTQFTLTLNVTGLPKGTYHLYYQALVDHYSNNISYTVSTNGGTSKTGSLPTSFDAQSDQTNNAIDAIRQSADAGKYEWNDIQVADDGVLNIQFSKGSNDSSGGLYLDNIILEYLGDNVAETTINLDFPEHYNTFILPFDASADEIAALNNDNIFVFEASHLTDKNESVEVTVEEKDANGNVTGSHKETMDFKYHLINLKDATTQVVANVPYVAINEDIAKSVIQVNAQSMKAPSKAPASKSYAFTGYPTNYVNEYTDAAGILTGVHEETSVRDDQYVQGTSDTQGFQYFGKDEGSGNKTVKANRTYVKSTSKASENMILFDDEAKITTGVEDVVEEVEALTAETPTDVYTISGMIVRSQVPYAEALSDLPRGIYIVRAGTRAHKVAL